MLKQLRRSRGVSILIQINKFILVICSLLIVDVCSVVFAGRYGGDIDFDIYSLNGTREGETSSMRAFEEDRHGFIWMSGWNGLFRYDGNKIKKYLYDVSKTNGLSDSTVSVIRKGLYGKLWVGTIVGLNRLDPETNQFENFYHKPNDENSLSNNAIVSLLTDIDGSVWIGTWGGGLNHYDPDSRKFTRIEIGDHSPTALAGAFVTGLAHGRNNTIWVLTRDHGVFRYERKSRSFTPVKYSSEKSQSWWSDRNIVQSQDGFVWFVTRNALHRIDQDHNTIQSWLAPAQMNRLKSVQVDQQGIVWLSAARGKKNLASFNPVTERFAVYDIDVPAQGIYLSADNKLWLAGTNSDVRILSKTPVAFENISPSHEPDQSFLHNEISPFFFDQQERLWLVAQDRVFSKQVYDNDVVLKQKLSLDRMVDSPASLDVQHSIWLASRDIRPGLVQYDTKTNHFYAFRHNPRDINSVSSDRVLNITTVGDDVWLATDLGLNRFSPKTGKFERFYVNPDHKNNEGLNSLNLVLKGRGDFLWLGSWYNGLFKFDLKTLTFTPFESRELNIGETITSLNLDDDGTLWITSNNGFFALNEAKGIYRSYTPSDGLDTTVICSVKDDYNRVWIGSRSFLYVLDVASGRIVRLGHKEGLNGEVFFENMCTRDSRGRLYFMSNKAMNIIDSRHYRLPDDANRVMDVFLTDFRLNNQSVAIDKDAVLAQDIRSTDALVLDSHDNSFSIHFSALEFYNPQKITYQYRLLPIYKEWITTNFDLPFAAFTNIKPGSYTFEVRSQYGSFGAASPTRKLDVTILHAWYQTSLAKFLFLILGLTVLGAVLYFLRQRQFEKEQVSNAIKNSAALMRKLLNALPNETLMLDVNGICTYANKAGAAFIGCQQHSCVGIDVVKRIAEKNFDQLPVLKEEGFLQCLSSKETVRPYRYHYFLNKNNEYIPVKYTSTPIYEAENYQVISGVVLTFFDASEQIKAEEKLLQSEKMDIVSTLLDGVVHDFNNTLQVINFTVGGVLAFGDPPQSLKKELNVIAKAADGAMNLCSRLMAISNNDMTISLKRIDINQELPVMVDFVKKIAGQSITFSSHVLNEKVWIRADENLLQNALLNLALNSKEAMLENAANNKFITFYLSKALVDGEHYAVVKVVDNGRGISEEDLTKVREPFYSTKKHSKGTGLGIPMVDRFMKKIGGSLDIASIKGECTCASLYFPIVDDVYEPVGQPCLVDTTLARGNQETILVVEDNLAHLSILDGYLTRLNYRPYCVQSVDQALALYDRHRHFDLVLSDFMLEGSENGIDLVKKIQAINSKQKYCLMTGYIAIKKDRITLQDFGEVLIKPFSIHELANRLHKLIHHSSFGTL